MSRIVDGKPLVGADRVVAVLVMLGDYPAGASLDELAERLSSSKPTVHRALSTLRRAGLAMQVGRGTYRLGDEFLRLALRFQSGRPEAELIEPALRQLVNRYNETAHFAVLMGAEVVYRAKLDPPAGGVRLSSFVGGRNPAHRTAVGKLLLSFTIDSEAGLNDLLGDTLLEASTCRSLTRVDELWEELQRTRKRGYATDAEENEAGINCVAVPVRWSRHGQVDGAVSVSGLAFRTPLSTLVEDVHEIRRIVEVTAFGESAGHVAG